MLKNRSFERINDIKNSPAMDIKSIQRRYNELLEEVLQKGIEDGTVRERDVRSAAMNIIAMLVGSAWLALFFDEDADKLHEAALNTVRLSLSLK
jgi:hypothetical protein